MEGIMEQGMVEIDISDQVVDQKWVHFDSSHLLLIFFHFTFTINNKSS